MRYFDARHSKLIDKHNIIHTVVWKRAENIAGIATTDKYELILPYWPNLSLVRKWLLITIDEIMPTPPSIPGPAFNIYLKEPKF